MLRIHVAAICVGLAACTTVVRLGPVPSVAVSAQAVCPAPFGPFEGACEFDFADLRMAVTGKGKGSAYRESKLVSTFSLPLGDGYLEKLYYLDYGGDLLLIFGASDGESGWGGAMLLRTRDSSAVWLREMRAFNIGPATLERAALYVTGIGFVGRIDAESGDFVWKHEGLYCQDDGSFNAFDAPRVTPTEAWFQEATSVARPLKVIRVRKSDGHPSTKLTDRCSGPATPATER
jgi:hypothetical protein